MFNLLLTYSSISLLYVYIQHGLNIDFVFLTMLAHFPWKRLINFSSKMNISTFTENPSLSLLSKSGFESKTQQDRKLRTAVMSQRKHLQRSRISALCLLWEWNVATGVIASKTPSDGTVTKLLVYIYSQKDSCGTNPHCPLADSLPGCVQGDAFFSKR